MKRFLVALLCIAIPVVASDNGYKITYDGGSIPDVQTGKVLKLHFDPSQIRLMKGKEAVATIPNSAITEVSYGQDVHRRVGAAIAIASFTFGVGMLMALAKSKKHFIGLTWDDNGQKGGAAFQADKSDYRGVLSGIEGVTGKKAVNSETMTVKN